MFIRDGTFIRYWIKRLREVENTIETRKLCKDNKYPACTPNKKGFCCKKEGIFQTDSDLFSK